MSATLTESIAVVMASDARYLLLIGIGVVAGTINAIAGGGSFLTLPVLIFLGLPSVVANGTNRVGVLVQSAASVLGFQRASSLDRRWVLITGIPALFGSALGTWGALYVNDETFRRVLAVAMIVITLATALAPDPRAEATVHPRRPWLVALGFAAVGLYGGFLQAGVGFLALAITTWSGLDLVRGNAIKVVSVLLVTALACLLFALNGSIEWSMGIALAIGNAIGAAIGVRLALAKGHRWLKGALTLTIVAIAIRLWLL